jgi:hypothetical protein
LAKNLTNRLKDLGKKHLPADADRSEYVRTGLKWPKDEER